MWSSRRLDDVPFEGEQEQAYEEYFQQLAEKGKWPFPLCILRFIQVISC